MSLIDPDTIINLCNTYNELSKTTIATIPRFTKESEPKKLKNIDELEIVCDAKELWDEKVKPKLAGTEYFALMISGEQGSGKTDVARQFTCIAEQEGYKKLYFSSLDVLDMPATAVEKAGGALKLVVILDDISYTLGAISNQEASKLKNWVALIRHALKRTVEGEVKYPEIFIIIIGHFTTSVPPMLRNTSFWLFPAPTTQEQDAMVKIIGRQQKARRRLQTVVDALKAITDIAKPGETLEIDIYGNGHPIDFTWDVDGRLQLLLKSGDAMIFHSKQNYCSECAKIGKDVKVDPSNYVRHKKDDKESLR